MLVEQGENVCKAVSGLEPPLSQVELGQFAYGFWTGVKKYMSQEQTATFIGYSIGAFCPEYIGNSAT